MLMVSGAENQAETAETIQKAIKIEEDLQTNKKVKTALLGRLYYCNGTVLIG